MTNLKYTTIILFIGMLCVSCGNEVKNDNDQQASSVKEKVKKGTSTIDKIGNIKSIREALKSKEPIDIKIMENWLPETVMGMQKAIGGALTQNGGIGVNAKYLKEHPEYGRDYGKNVSILIIDGHGEKGAIAVLEFLSIQQEGNVTYDNTRVKEEYNSNNKSYTLSFFYNDRFGVEMTAKGFKQEELWDVFKAFKLDELTNNKK